MVLSQENITENTHTHTLNKYVVESAEKLSEFEEVIHKELQWEGEHIKLLWEEKISSNTQMKQHIPLAGNLQSVLTLSNVWQGEGRGDGKSLKRAYEETLLENYY